MKSEYFFRSQQKKIEYFIETVPAYGDMKKELVELKNDILKSVTEFYLDQHDKYQKFFNLMSFNSNYQLEKNLAPWIPVDYFKLYDITNINLKNTKIITSSGTTNNNLSRIPLNFESRKNQTKILHKILTHWFGKKRGHFIIIDKPYDKKNELSASQIAAIGFSLIGSRITYALTNEDKLDYKLIKSEYDLNSNDELLIFGFTSKIYAHLLNSDLEFGQRKIKVIHGGGWKKLSKLKISKENLYQQLRNKFGDIDIIDYYGMAEQAGSIYIECKKNNYHVSNFSDVIVRNQNFDVSKKNEVGLLQTISILPFTYPGHSILTLDLGYVPDGDVCSCGVSGKVIRILGRIDKSQLRGCGDV